MSDKAITTYEVVTHNGTFQIDIPSDWKVTFGPVAIGAGSKRYSSYDGGGSMALRLYESETKQRAVFVGVESFRDMSIPLRRKIRTVGTESTSRRSPKGSKSSERVDIEESWEVVA